MKKGLTIAGLIVLSLVLGPVGMLISGLIVGFVFDPFNMSKKDKNRAGQ